MNIKRLHSVFQEYIDKFEYINNSANDENYKWEIAYEFQFFDLDAEDFTAELLRLLKITSNFIDNGYGLPFRGLVEYSKNEPETVRKMFKDLYVDDNGNIDIKQEKIKSFINKSEELRKKYAPDSHLFINNQKSVMQLLFLKDPNHNYTYKATEAKSFADCVEFYDDWGPMSDFKLDVFYRMCDMLVKEIKEYPELIETHKSRYEKNDRNMHLDEELHILAFDIIYSSQVYDFYREMDFVPINAQARKLHEERVKKAKQYFEILKKARKEKQDYDNAIEYFKNKYVAGTSIKHKFLKNGVISEISDELIALVVFNGSEKKFDLKTMLANSLIIIEDEDIKNKVEKYKAVLTRSNVILQNLAAAEKDFSEYAEYLN